MEQVKNDLMKAYNYTSEDVENYLCMVVFKYTQYDRSLQDEAQNY